MKYHQNVYASFTLDNDELNIYKEKKNTCTSRKNKRRKKRMY